ncbi:hypothetical protein F8O01_11285 [Pseudoclavibacter chungangensis]|uniref:Bacterial bifunctional deaminase-reductase C-terminal domain-containing protein n=1 Tax=Pseudoclavibacter chungangensis TaxID=587635 RepID=A0A7J5BQH5_9MICO|nr:dihydrofolate reductase family protein [Pseudoclavibacter chungangensis]KAB1656013.1 hypothetical protein F8O01_11285 [Pseudoclavibacter chungangensis]NYJ66468.1 riboflavin biosynthesis pyrimidine reductase [Pseudoclavibacter chungangensis]
MTDVESPAATLLRILWRSDELGGGTDASPLALASPASDAAIDALYATPAGPWIRMNMLGTLNARVTGPDGTSDSVTNRIDRRILTRIRRMSDAIVVGASTLRQERHTATGDTPLVVVTRSGELAGHRITPDEARHGVVVLCPPIATTNVERTLPGARVEIVDAPGGGVPVGTVVERCRALGFERLVVEGGGSLIAQFLDAELLDEACLTQAPLFGPSDAPQLPASTAATRFERVLVALDDAGYAYSRLVARRGAATSAD